MMIRFRYVIIDIMESDLPHKLGILPILFFGPVKNQLPRDTKLLAKQPKCIPSFTFAIHGIYLGEISFVAKHLQMAISFK